MSEAESAPSVRAIVVIGAPRSGTTLVATAMGIHPEVALLSEDCEGAMFHIVGGKIPAVKLCIPNQVDLIRRRRSSYALVRWNGWLRKNVEYRLPRSRLSLQDMATRADLAVLCVLRDPTKNLAAIKRRDRMSDRVCYDMLRRTYRIFQLVREEPRMKRYIVSFDRLVAAPEPYLRSLCERIGLAFDPAMLGAPRLNPTYPEATFRIDKAAATDIKTTGSDFDVRSLREAYEKLMAQAL